MSASRDAPHRIVIVGGGAGGLPLATALGEKFGRHGRAEITLVDRYETHVWKPLLHEVAAIGGSMMIQGLIARWMYVSLYKMRQVSIHGYVRVVLDTIGRFLRRRMEPRVKLH